MAYAGLESIYQNEGPMSGAITGGAREGLAGFADLQSMSKNQQAYNQAEQMNPLDVQFRQGQVSAQAPELEKAQLENRKTRGTIDSSIDSTNATNYANVTKQQFEKVSNMGRIAGELGIVLSQTPPGLQRQQVAVEYMRANGIDPQSKAGQYVLNSEPQALVEISDKIAKHRDAYIQAMGTSEQAGRNQQAGIRATGEEARKTRQMEIDAGRYAKSGQGIKNIEDQIKAGKLTYEKAATLLFGAAQFETDPAQQEKYMEMARTYEAMGIRAKQAMGEGKVDLNSVTGLPTRTVPPVTGMPQGQPGGQPKPQHSLTDVQKMYPGVPPEKIREAYKKKFGVDLQ